MTGFEHEPFGNNTKHENSDTSILVINEDKDESPHLFANSTMQSMSTNSNPNYSIVITGPGRSDSHGAVYYLVNLVTTDVGDGDFKFKFTFTFYKNQGAQDPNVTGDITILAGYITVAPSDDDEGPGGGGDIPDLPTPTATPEAAPEAPPAPPVVAFVLPPEAPENASEEAAAEETHAETVVIAPGEPQVAPLESGFPWWPLLLLIPALIWFLLARLVLVRVPGKDGEYETVAHKLANRKEKRWFVNVEKELDKHLQKYTEVLVEGGGSLRAPPRKNFNLLSPGGRGLG